MTHVLLLAALMFLQSSRAADPPAFPPERIEDYTAETIGGYEVRFSRDALTLDPATLDRLRLHLEADLDEINHLLPSAALERLSDVVIWVEKGGPGTRYGRGMGVHWSADWLRPRGFLVEKVGHIQINDIEDFLAWRSTQPYMLLHEFAHAYHQRVHAQFPASVAAAYEKARAQGRYDALAHTRNLEPAEAYAMTNVSEYFAELSEAYFALNDFFPHTRGQLALHDPEGLAAVEAAWRVLE